MVCRVRRMRIGLAIAVAAVVAVVVVLAVGSGPGRSRQSVYWGAEIGPQFTGTPAPFDMRALTKFSAGVGRTPGVVAFNLPFEACSGRCSFEGFPAGPMTALRARGAIPLLNWSSQSSPLSVTQPGFRLSTVASGSFDHYIRTFATEARAWGHPFFLRFDWEMNQSWFPWGQAANGNQAGEFAATWRHVHDIFTAAGATNVTWVWCPYASLNPSVVALRRLYPGDRYVDWTCLDGYNFGVSGGAGNPWRSFRSIFGPSYQAITRHIAPDKPMIVGEVASSERGGSKRRWIQAMLQAIPAHFRRIRGVLWFDARNTQSGSRDAELPLESSAASLSAFSRGLGSIYAGNRFGSIVRSPISPPSR